jgi:hypothetical protein
MKWLWDHATSSDVVQQRLQAALCSLHREYEDPLNPEAAEETLKMRKKDPKVFAQANKMLPSLRGEESRTPELIPGIPFSDLRQLNMPPLRQTWLRFNVEWIRDKIVLDPTIILEYFDLINMVKGVAQQSFEVGGEVFDLRPFDKAYAEVNKNETAFQELFDEWLRGHLKEDDTGRMRVGTVPKSSEDSDHPGRQYYKCHKCHDGDGDGDFGGWVDEFKPNEPAPICRTSGISAT